MGERLQEVLGSILIGRSDDNMTFFCNIKCRYERIFNFSKQTNISDSLQVPLQVPRPQLTMVSQLWPWDLYRVRNVCLF